LPDVDESERAVENPVATVETLVRLTLIAWHDKDRTHLSDMVGVGLLDATWLNRLPARLGDRMQRLLDDPNG
jgi:hypothetical protein